jgi:hypothetical protein
MIASHNKAPRLKFGGVRPASQVWIAILWLLILVTSVIADSKTYDITKYGAIPNDGKNDTHPIRMAINEANMLVVVPSISLGAFMTSTRLP